MLCLEHSAGLEGMPFLIQSKVRTLDMLKRPAIMYALMYARKQVIIQKEVNKYLNINSNISHPAQNSTYQPNIFFVYFDNLNSVRNIQASESICKPQLTSNMPTVNAIFFNQRG